VNTTVSPGILIFLIPFGFGGVVLVILPNKYTVERLVGLIDYTGRPVRRGKRRHRNEGDEH
jgi:hypothetical protein